MTMNRPVVLWVASTALISLLVEDGGWRAKGYPFDPSPADEGDADESHANAS
jgi:hypothetical protein